MKDSWHDKEFVKDWDTGISRTHPTRAEQLDILTSVVAKNYEEGKFIVDIGFGSGQVEELIFNKVPNARIVGVDSSAEMIGVANERLVKYGDNFQAVLKNIPDLEISDLPSEKYQFVISVQMLHEITNEQKETLFEKIYKLLPSNGQFLIMDRIRVDLETFSNGYSGVWQRLEDKFSWNSAKSYEEYKQNIKEKEDTPASLDEYFQLLKKTGFEPTVLHLHFDRALIVGGKK